LGKSERAPGKTIGTAKRISFLYLCYTVNPVKLFMLRVIAKFVLNVKGDQGEAGHSGCQAEEIDGGGCFVSDEVSPGNDNVISDHGSLNVSKDAFLPSNKVPISE